MRRLGILSRTVYPNYGTILQAFALQSAIERAGAEACVVDYVTPEDRPFALGKATLRTSQFKGSRARNLAYLALQTPVLAAAALVFRHHQKRLLHLTPSAADASELGAVTAKLDGVVAGSDQVWNRSRPQGTLDPNFFLPFCGPRTERLSYAASMGGSQPHPEDEAEVLDGLRALDTVSLREPSSAEWVRAKGIDARSDVDPTLLHDREFWSRFAGKRRIRGPYVLVYQLHHTPQFTAYLRQIQRKHGLRIVRVTPDLKHIVRYGSPRVLVSPEHWVALFRDASYVVTDSFHATVFALKFGVPLYSVSPEAGKSPGRIVDFLARVNLSRLLVPLGTEDVTQFSPTYDAEGVRVALEAQAEDSLRYLGTLATRREHANG